MRRTLDTHDAVIMDGAEECDCPLVFPLHGEDAVVSLGGEDLSLCKLGGGYSLGTPGLLLRTVPQAPNASRCRDENRGILV